MEKSLAQSCHIFLEILKKLRDSGQISQLEYEKHACLKLRFLESYYNQQVKHSYAFNKS